MGYELPETINPETISFCITIPDETWHIRAFWGAMWTLTRPYNWGNDEAHTALEVAEVWRDLWFQNFTDWRERGCMDDPCCSDEINLLQKIVNLMESGMTVSFNGAGTTPPDTTAGSCAPDFFDHDTDETDGDVLAQREKALCATVERYVKAVLLAALTDMGAPSVLIDYVDSQLPAVVPLPLTKVVVVYPALLEGLGAFFAMIDGGLTLSFIVCAMIDALSGDKNNTFSNFRTALDGDTGLDTAFAPLVALVDATNGLKNNYLAFNEALELANDEDLTGYECPCAPPDACEEPLDLVNLGDEDTVDTVITPLGDDLYHIVQNTHQSPSNGNRYIASFKDSLGRCLFIETTVDTQAGIGPHNVHGCSGFGEDCDGEGSLNVGGFAPIKGIDAAWQSSDPIDTVYKITCCSTPE